MAAKQDPGPANGTSPGASTPPAMSEDERAALDARVLAGDPVAAPALTAVLQAPDRPQGELLRAYATRLLDHALAARDTDAAVLVTRLMDSDRDLDRALYALLNERVQSEPDSVYALLRARVAADPTERWLFRLRVSAVCALQVAIVDGDTETTINWLRLIAREPGAYELGDLVHHALMAALERARTDGALGRLLVPLAVRRDPAALDALLGDPAVLDAMAADNNLGRVLRDHDGNLLLTLQNHGADMAVVALARAAQARKPALFTPAVIEQLWPALTGAQPINVPPAYAPETILAAWAESGALWLDESALQTILVLALRDRRDEFFAALAHALAPRDTFVRMLTAALQRSGRPDTDILMLVNGLQASGDLTPQAAADVLVRLLGLWEWRRSSLPVVQHLARVLQTPTIVVHPDVIWRLLEIAGETKDETLARTTVRRLQADIEATEDETALVDKLVRLVGDVQWHPATRQAVQAWWRSYARAAGLARLQRIDKVMEGKRALDEMRAVLQTVISFRKMLGKRTLPQFAWDVGVAYGILQALMESFDPSPKRPAAFDMATMRAELDARADELTPQERQIMANNFKELAQLIAGMGDNRSKASLMRRGDDLDRLLMTGDQQPHSAVDTLKWLAGYLSGSQEKEEADEE